MRDLVLGLDIGGGGVRCLALRAGTRATAFASRPWLKGTILPLEGFGYGLDTTLVWRQIGPVVRDALRVAGAEPDDVAGIATSSMRHSLVALDDKGTVLLGSPNLDARAIAQAMALVTEHGDRLYALSGHRPLPNLMGPKLRWLADSARGDFERVALAMTISDWVGFRMSGVASAELSQAAESLLFDLHSRRWSTEAGEMLGLSLSLLPPLVESGTRIGDLLPSVAEELGLRSGTPVVAAGADTQTALLGLGAVSPGDLAVVGGTTAPVQMVMDRPLVDVQQRLWTGLHAAPGLYVLESNAGNMGHALAWTAAVLYSGHPDPVGALVADAERVEAGGVISTVGASVFNTASLGLPVEHLSFSTTNRGIMGTERAQFGHATLEGMAFAVKANIDQIAEVAGASCTSLLVGGGLGRSHLWTETLSQATGLEARVGAVSEVTALGAAICAGVGAGLFADVADGARATAAAIRVHNPEPVAQHIHRERFEAWMALRGSRAEADLVAAEMLMPFQARPEPPVSQGKGADRAFRPMIYVAADFGVEPLAALRDLGDVTYASYREGQVLVGADLVEALQGVQVFVTEVDLVDAEVLQQLPDLRLVAVCRGSPTNVDLAACSAAGVPVVHTPGRNADAVADLTVGMMLMLARKLPGATQFLREPGGEAGDMGRMGQAYFRYQGHELWHKTVGVIGGGAVGQRVIKRLLPFEVKILLRDPFVSVGQAVLMGARKVSLDELLAESDFVTLHAPVTDETRGVLNDAAFARMRDGAFLVNTARAALVDTGALVRALASGKLGGAALDVFDVEPPGADDALLAFENVIATPHIGGDTFEVGIHQGMMVVESLRQLLHGEQPEHVLNPEVLERFTWTGDLRVRAQDLRRLASAPGPGLTDLDAAQQVGRGAGTVSVPNARKGGFLRRLLGRRGEGSATPAAPVSADDGTGSLPGTDTAAGPGTADARADASTAARYLQIIKRFLDLLQQDAGLADGAVGKDVVFLYTLKDTDWSFYMSFVDGVVQAGLGEPQREPHVRLKMDAVTFDGIMLGTVNGMQAAMTGKLAFSGDTRRAMSMQRFQRGMGGAYQQARAEIGDPGDLASLAQSGLEAPASAPQRLVVAEDDRAASEITVMGDVRDEMLRVVNELYARGLITATGGNVSARSEGNPEQVWITPSAVFKGDLRADMMVKIDLEGRMIGESEYAASSERYVHCAIYRTYPEVSAIIHSHAPQSTLMALTGVKFVPISADAAFIGEIPVVPFLMPGTPELAEAVAGALRREGTQGGIAVLMQNHGLVVAGTSPRRAADMTETIERSAESLLACRMLGVAPPLLPEEVVSELREMGKMLA